MASPISGCQRLQRRADLHRLTSGADLDLIAKWLLHAAQEMAGINHWSIALAGARSRRPRWLTERGHLSSDQALALRLVSPDVAALRIKTYMKLRGWPTEATERFVLVPSPPEHGLIDARNSLRLSS